MILAGDVGGTKTNLGLFELGEAGPRLAGSASFPSSEFSGLGEVVKLFLAGSGQSGREIGAACFGIAGPVIDNRTSTPNLAWEIDGAALAAEIGVAAVELINDLVATAEGIAALAAGELQSLQQGSPARTASVAPAGNQVLIAAGTGLGMALLPVAGSTRVIIPSEGGHADFAPRDEDEIGLLRYLNGRFGEHVSVERVVSGPGLRAIYDYLRDSGFAPEDSRVREALAAGDPSRVIGEEGLAGTCRLSSRTLDLFAAAYGAAAGNLALVATATGGVYVGGGIAPKILPRLAGGIFVRAFRDKGRFASYLERIPVQVILNDRTALLGAARAAARLAATGSAGSAGSAGSV
ncbi:MAG TPA: glucokinase [Thermoanaerobaculia bacterium]|nr:glucokinase [Thermoanaerobaculia bacterium]